MSEAKHQELTVRGESIESFYRNYRQEKYWTNRRYQRKLIWTLEEKQSFLDSIAKGYPVPIILLAEASDAQNRLEIIDGMQRLNAIASFLENHVSLDGKYFDLNTMAATKSMLDEKLLDQKKPTLPRDVCVAISSYELPVSVFEYSDEAAVDEVFRRINSGGRKLSRQELRAAGSTGHFATLVRKVAAKIRGDDTLFDMLKLNSMSRISITNKDLDYGIPVETVFWVEQNILTREQVRESRDEELIADILAYIALDGPAASRSELLDNYFGIFSGETNEARFKDIEKAVQKTGADVIEANFFRAFDMLRLLFGRNNTTFGKLMFDSQPNRAPRYFQAVFLAFYELIVSESMRIIDEKKLVKKMTDQAKSIDIQEGGRWGRESRNDTIKAVAGVYRECFEKDNELDPSKHVWITRFENLLTQSLTEQSQFDYKVGFLRVDGSNNFDDNSFEKILKTLSAMANNRKGAKGYVIVGVSESPSTSKQISKVYGVTPTRTGDFDVFGIAHEIVGLGKTEDQFFQLIADKVTNSKLSEPLKAYVARNLRAIRYFDKTVYIFEAEGQPQVSSYDNKWFDRRGNQLSEVAPEALPEFITRYAAT